MVLIPKRKPDVLESTSTYRSICVLNAIGKKYEILIRERLVEELNEKKEISVDNLVFAKAARQSKQSSG